jgi:hypothetical protein
LVILTALSWAKMLPVTALVKTAIATAAAPLDMASLLGGKQFEFLRLACRKGYTFHA